MTTDPIDLDAIEARAKDASAAIFAGDWFVVQRGAAARLAREDVPALLVEVRRLRALVDVPDTIREEGRRLASKRDDLIAAGVDPADLDVPL